MAKRKRRSQRRAPLVVEELEPRVLFSADLAALADVASAAGAAGPVPSTDAGQANSQLMQAAQVAVQSHADEASNDASNGSTADGTGTSVQRIELVFVDGSVDHADELIKELQAQRGEGRTLLVFTIDAQRDGLQQISDVLSRYQRNQSVDAIHLITHGDAQGLQIGSTWLNEHNLVDYAKQVAGWGLSLRTHADLLLYGCDLAASDSGRQLVDDLGLLTGADVAASTNITGASEAGGDWTLEYSKGQIESRVAASALTQADWRGTLLLTNSGSESLVNTTTSGTQTTATNRQVASDASGNYVVIWQKGTTLYGQRFNSSGVKQGAEFKMATSGGLFSTVNSPQVAMNASGAYAVTWYEYNPGILGILLPTWTVYMQRFNAAGTSLGVTHVFSTTPFLTFSGDPQMYSSIAMDDSGNTAVVTRNGSEVEIEWYNSSGSQTGSARVDAGNGNTKNQVSVAMTAAGTVVTWTESGTEIYGQLYNTSHTAVGGNFHVNTTTTGAQTQSSVGMDSTGAFVVSWTSTQGGTNDVYAQRFSSAGAKLGSEFQVNATSADSQDASSVAVDGSGSFLIAWQSNLQDGSGTGIYVRQYYADGFAGLYDQVVNTTTSGAQSTPSVAFRGTQAVVAWSGNGAGDATGIFAQRLTVGPNQAPTATLGAANLNYTENAGAVALDGTLLVADADNSTLQGATLQITGNYVNGQDVLQFTNAFGITGIWNAANGTLTLSGTALKANYQQALRSVTYSNSSDNPSAAVRTVSISVTDGQLNSSVLGKTITVLPVNDAPTLTAPPVIAVIQDTPTIINGITLADLDAGTNLITLSFTAASGTFNAISTAQVTVTGDSTATLVLQGKVADINSFILGNSVTYTTVLGGTGAVAFSLSADDGGNTGSGGTKTATFNGALSTVVVSPPSVSASPSVSVVEDLASAVTGISITANAAGSNAVQLKLTVGAGSLAAVSGAGVIVSQPQSDTLVLVGNAASLNAFIAAGQVGYLTAANANGSVALNIALDDLQQSYPGLNLYDNASASLSITPVNDAPQGASNTVVTLEDHAHVFSAADFGFSDANDAPANLLAGVRISTLPAAGTLTLNVSGVATAVSLGQVISKADLDAGNLVFNPAADASGAGYASFNFQVQDDGGTASGGVDLDATARTLTVDVVAVNDAPQGADNTVTLLEDGSYTFSQADFAFTDTHDTPADTWLGVVITSLPDAGTLTLSGTPVQSGDFIGVANLGNLVYTPEANGSGAAHASFAYAVRDNGGTLSGGIDTDQTPRTMTLSVTPINDAPQAADGAVVTLSGSAHIFKLADFGFSDVLDSPADALLAIRVVGLPAAGSLTLAGVPVTAAQVVLASDIAAGQLVFAPTADQSGQAYAALQFQVRDSGGTANGGVDWDAHVHTLTISVLAPAASTPLIKLSALPEAKVEEAEVKPQAIKHVDVSRVQLVDNIGNGGAHFGEFAVRMFDVSVSDTGFTVDMTSGRAQEGRGYDGDWLANGGKVTPIQWLIDQIQGQRLARSDGSSFASVAQDVVHWNPEASDAQELQSVATSIKSGGVAVSVGAVWWATRLSGLMTGLMASTPAWRTLDPLPILGKTNEGFDEAADDGGDFVDEDDSDDEQLGERDAGELFASVPNAHSVPISGGTL